MKDIGVFRIQCEKAFLTCIAGELWTRRTSSSPSIAWGTRSPGTWCSRNSSRGRRTSWTRCPRSPRSRNACDGNLTANSNTYMTKNKYIYIKIKNDDETAATDLGETEEDCARRECAALSWELERVREADRSGHSKCLLIRTPLEADRRIFLA